jgi:hypothetical protein
VFLSHNLVPFGNQPSKQFSSIQYCFQGLIGEC